MNKYFVVIILFFLIGIHSNLLGQYSKEDSIMISKIGWQTMEYGEAYNDLSYLCKNIGHRVSGSPQAQKAVDWALKLLKEADADTVYLQPVRVPVWVRGEESLHIKIDNEFEKVEMLSLGNTTGTNGKVLEAPIIIFNSMLELEQADAKNIKGKIVFLNVKFPRNVLSTFDGYGSIFMIRWDGAGLAASREQ